MAPLELNIDYYAVLEISNTATAEIVTKSYRRLARIQHPDKNLGGVDTTATFQLVSPRWPFPNTNCYIYIGCEQLRSHGDESCKMPTTRSVTLKNDERTI